MEYLIDTQVLVWALVSPAKLSVNSRNTLQTSTVYVSVLSLFEIAVKQKIGKLPELPVTTNMLVEQIKRDRIELMPLTVRHIAMYDKIPFYADHREPRSVVTV